MRETMTPTAAEASVVDEAAAVVATAVRSTLVAALRAASCCGCRHCRVRAVQTFQWADALLPSAGSPDSTNDGHGEPTA